MYIYTHTRNHGPCAESKAKQSRGTLSPVKALVLKVQCRVHLDAVGGLLCLKSGRPKRPTTGQARDLLCLPLSSQTSSLIMEPCALLWERRRHMRQGREIKPRAPLLPALLGRGWEGWGARWEGREITFEETDVTSDLLGPWLPRHRTALANHRPPSMSLSPLISPWVSMCLSPLPCCPLSALYVGLSPAPRPSLAIRTLRTFKNVFFFTQID